MKVNCLVGTSNQSQLLVWRRRTFYNVHEPQDFLSFYSVRTMFLQQNMRFQEQWKDIWKFDVLGCFHCVQFLEFNSDQPSMRCKDPAMTKKVAAQSANNTRQETS